MRLYHNLQYLKVDPIKQKGNKKDINFIKQSHNNYQLSQIHLIQVTIMSANLKT